MSPTKLWTASLSALAFLIVSGLGTHIHLCFDGQEPAASVHMLDGEHLDHHAGEVHDDLDIDPLGKPLPKLFKLEIPALALLIVCAFLLLNLPQTVARPLRRIAPPLLPPRYLHPLLRAPPL